MISMILNYYAALSEYNISKNYVKAIFKILQAIFDGIIILVVLFGVMIFMNMNI